MVFSLGYFGDPTSCKTCELNKFLYKLLAKLTTFYSDFSEYRRVRAQEDDNRGGAGGNQSIELPSIQRHI